MRGATAGRPGSRPSAPSNPEPEHEWNTTDSIVDVYGPYLDGAFETRTLAQLADVVLRIS